MSSSNTNSPDGKVSVFRRVLVIALPVVAALIVRLLFGVSDWSRLYSVMTLTFLTLCPYLIGAIAVRRTLKGVLRYAPGWRAFLTQDGGA